MVTIVASFNQQLFVGNTEKNTWKRHCLHRYYGEPVPMRYIRFYPVTDSKGQLVRTHFINVITKTGIELGMLHFFLSSTGNLLSRTICLNILSVTDSSNNNVVTNYFVF